MDKEKLLRMIEIDLGCMEDDLKEFFKTDDEKFQDAAFAIRKNIITTIEYLQRAGCITFDEWKLLYEKVEKVFDCEF